MAVEMTLTEKVLAILRAEDFLNPVDKGANALPKGERLGEFELDLRDWGMTYGIAVGLARTEEPCEPIQDVVARARPAALEAFTTSGDDRFAARPPADDLVQAVLRAYRDGAGNGLNEAVSDLGNATGWPTTAEVTA